MKKILFLIFVIIFANSLAYAAIIYEGVKHEGQLVSPYVFEIQKGPEFPESKFKLLKLPEEYYSAYYRLLFGCYEITQFVAVELIGVHDESDPSVLSTYYLPEDEMRDDYLKNGIDFSGWIDYQTFILNINGEKIIRVINNGKFELINSSKE